jgi:hypothetical protein
MTATPFGKATNSKQRHEPGPPMTLGNMRELGVHHLIAYCLNDACRHRSLAEEAVTEIERFRLSDMVE